MSRLDNVDVRLLRVFVTVVDGGGFSGAQTKLNVGASTISNHMSALETRLGVKLCHRGRSGFRLTPDGEVIYSEALKLFGALDAFDFTAGRLKSSLRSSLALGIVANTISDPQAPLHAAIAHFTGNVREVRLVIECRPPNELLHEVAEGRLDVAIGSFPRKIIGLNYQPIYKETHFFYCGARHPLFTRPDDEIGSMELSQHLVVARDYWAGRDMREIRPERIPAKVDNMESEARLILSGCFLGYLPEHYAATWVACGEMRPIRPSELRYEAPFDVVYSDTAKERMSVQRFLDAVDAAFSSAPKSSAAQPLRPSGRRREARGGVSARRARGSQLSP